MATAPFNLGEPPETAEAQPPQGNMATMLGADDGDAAANRAFVQRIRVLMTGLDDLARQFPAFARFSETATTAIQQGMVEVLRSAQQEGSAGTPITG